MYIIGADEAGRGSLAGPIVGGAVSFHKPNDWKKLRDSKQYTARQREALFKNICKDAWVAYAIRDASFIDDQGIQLANELVLSEPIDSVYHKLDEPEDDEFTAIADGNLQIWNAHSEPKADENYPEVAGASIVAKVLRDNIMVGYDELWPMYGFREHKGYYCDQHVDAIRKYGRCLIHRRSFKIKVLGEK